MSAESASISDGDQIESVASLSEKFAKHPNLIKTSAEQLKYLIAVESNNERNQVVRLTKYPQSVLASTSHYYQSDLAATTKKRNRLCADLVSRGVAVNPLIRCEYTTRNHLVNRVAPTVQTDLAVTSRKTVSGERHNKNGNVAEMLAASVKRSSASSNNKNERVSSTNKNMHPQFGDHEYCLTKSPLIAAFEKQASKTAKKTAKQKLSQATSSIAPEITVKPEQKDEPSDTNSDEETTNESRTAEYRSPSKSSQSSPQQTVKSSPKTKIAPIFQRRTAGRQKSEATESKSSGKSVKTETVEEKTRTLRKRPSAPAAPKGAKRSKKK